MLQVWSCARIVSVFLTAKSSAGAPMPPRIKQVDIRKGNKSAFRVPSTRKKARTSSAKATIKNNVNSQLAGWSGGPCWRGVRRTERNAPRESESFSRGTRPEKGCLNVSIVIFFLVAWSERIYHLILWSSSYPTLP